MLTLDKNPNLARRLSHIALRIWQKFGTHPKRRRQLARLTSPFTHKTDDGLYFNIDPTQYIDRYIFIEGIYERRFLTLLKALIPKGAVALDVGANIGNHAIYLGQWLSQIHCFEPNPETCRRLADNIALNKADHIHIHPVGLGEENTTLSFQVNLDGNLGASGFVDYTEQRLRNTEIIQLPIARGDDYLSQLKLESIDFIKIDVEGYESKVLRGLRHTIARHRPIVAFEFHGQHAGQEEFTSIRQSLPDYQFIELLFAPTLGSLMDKAHWWLRNGGRPQLININTPQPRTYENIIAVPQERFAPKD